MERIYIYIYIYVQGVGRRWDSDWVSRPPIGAGQHGLGYSCLRALACRLFLFFIFFDAVYGSGPGT